MPGVSCNLMPGIRYKVLSGTQCTDAHHSGVCQFTCASICFQEQTGRQDQQCLQQTRHTATVSAAGSYGCCRWCRSSSCALEPCHPAHDRCIEWKPGTLRPAKACCRQQSWLSSRAASADSCILLLPSKQQATPWSMTKTASMVFTLIFLYAAVL